MIINNSAMWRFLVFFLLCINNLSFAQDGYGYRNFAIEKETIKREVYELEPDCKFTISDLQSGVYFGPERGNAQAGSVFFIFLAQENGISKFFYSALHPKIDKMLPNMPVQKRLIFGWALRNAMADGFLMTAEKELAIPEILRKLNAPLLMSVSRVFTLMNTSKHSILMARTGGVKVHYEMWK